MVDSYRLSNALQALGEGVGQFGKMQFAEAQEQHKDALQARREAADQQFRATLQANMIKAEGDRENVRLAETAKDRELQRQLSQQTHADTISVERDRLASENQFRQQQLGMEGARLGLERDRMAQGKQNATQMRAAQVIQARISGLDRSLQAYNAQWNKEKSDQEKSTDYMTMDDNQKQQAMSKIDTKYAPLIKHQQDLRDKYNSKLGELTNVNFDDMGDQGGSTDEGGDDTSGGMPPAPSGIQASPAPSGTMPPKPPGLGAPATQAPSTPQTPYPEGTRLTGPDGKKYVVQGGKPVPAGT